MIEFVFLNDIHFNTLHSQVSAYGEEGVGDDGDDWVVVCSSDTWLKTSPVRLRHVATAKYLTVPGATFGRPIAGQYEITGKTLTCFVMITVCFLILFLFYSTFFDIRFFFVETSRISNVYAG